MTATARTRRFSALGTYAYLATTGCPDEAEAIARELLEAVDVACSRFRTDSHLTAANRNSGAWTPVGPLLLDAVEVALAAAAATDGLVDPCLGRRLVDLGYDRDFALLEPRRQPRPTEPPRPGAWQSVWVDRPAGALLVPDGVSLDLGATAKAWAGDLIAESLYDETGAAVLVSLGGDLRICGPVESDGWPVLITETPDGEQDTLPPELVCLDGGGLATSSTRVRRWRVGEEEHHHLIDPRTGRSARGPLRTVTATGPTCVAANVATTAALVLQDAGAAWLADRGVDARLVDVDGQVRHTGRWPAEQHQEQS